MNAICAGRLNEEDEKDVLIVGTASNILAYHVENNRDIFYKEVCISIIVTFIKNHLFGTIPKAVFFNKLLYNFV